MNINKNWWKKEFNKNYLEIYKERYRLDIVKKEVDFIIKNLNLKINHKILDLACGPGYHAIEFAKKGFNVIGLDYSQYLLKFARQEAIRQKIKNIKFIKGDMRKLKWKNYFDSVINLFTSFGYFEKDSDNELVLKNISQVLKRGGKFLIDISNLGYLIFNFI